MVQQGKVRNSLCDLIYTSLLAPSALGLQKLLKMCCDFSQDNDIIFNSLKSIHVVFRPKRYKLFCPPVYLHKEQDAREAMRVVFFCTYKMYLYAQNEISYEYIQILF